MLTRIFRLFFITLVIGLPAIGNSVSGQVLVSIPPYKSIVEKVAGETVEVNLLIPAGSSPHFFEPSARQVLKAAEADLWFQVGEGFEKRAEAALKSYRNEMRTVDLRNGLNLIQYGPDESHHQCGHSHDCYDPHVWMSPRTVIKQVETIKNELTQSYPEHAKVYDQNADQLKRELNQLDREIADTLRPLKNRVMMVSHPAFAYFARDYNLRQLPIEFEGKDPSPKQVTRTLQQARNLKVRAIYVQVQHSGKGAELIANQIGAKTIPVNPLEEEYFENLRKIAKEIARWNQ